MAQTSKETYRQIDRLTTNTDTHKEKKEIDRQRPTYIHTYIYTYIQRDRESYRQMDRPANRQKDRQRDRKVRQTNIQTDRLANTEIYRQTGRGTHRHANIHTQTNRGPYR